MSNLGKSTKSNLVEFFNYFPFARGFRDKLNDITPTGFEYNCPLYSTRYQFGRNYAAWMLSFGVRLTKLSNMDGRMTKKMAEFVYANMNDGLKDVFPPKNET